MTFVIALFIIYMGVDLLMKRGGNFIHSIKKFAKLIKILCGLGLFGSIIKMLREHKGSEVVS